MIAIITTWSKSLGMGHIQRMSSLAWFLNESKNIKTYLILERLPESFPLELKKYVKTGIDFSPDIIIRDMRNSSEEEIKGLKKISKVFLLFSAFPYLLFIIINGIRVVCRDKKKFQ